MTDYEVFEAPGFALKKGSALAVARLAYETPGTLAPDGGNVVLIPSWYLSYQPVPDRVIFRLESTI